MTMLTRRTRRYVPVADQEKVDKMLRSACRRDKERDRFHAALVRIYTTNSKKCKEQS